MKKLLIFLWLIAGVVSADSDTLLTKAEYGFRVANVLNLADTINGSDLLDSTSIQLCVSMAFNDVSRGISMPKAKRIILASGTHGYFIESGLRRVFRVTRMNGRSSIPLTEMTKKVVYSEDFITHLQDAGDSVAYYEVHGDSLYPYPIPQLTDTILVQYYGRVTHPDAMGDTVNVPYEYRDAIVMLSCYYASMLVGDGVKKDYFWNQYQYELVDILDKMIIREDANK